METGPAPQPLAAGDVNQQGASPGGPGLLQAGHGTRPVCLLGAGIGLQESM